MNCARANFAHVVLDNCVYAFGGISGRGIAKQNIIQLYRAALLKNTTQQPIGGKQLKSKERYHSQPSAGHASIQTSF